MPKVQLAIFSPHTNFFFCSLFQIEYLQPNQKPHSIFLFYYFPQILRGNKCRSHKHILSCFKREFIYSYLFKRQIAHAHLFAAQMSATAGAEWGQKQVPGMEWAHPHGCQGLQYLSYHLLPLRYVSSGSYMQVELGLKLVHEFWHGM